MKKEIKRVFIIGAGNVGSQLAIALKSIVEVVGVYSKSGVSAKLVTEQFELPFFESLEEIPSCDLVLICSNDDSIQSILEKLDNRFNVAYTSGSVELNQLPNRPNLGVFYPLQTFSKGRKVELNKVPFLIEATNEIFKNQLFDLGLKLSKNVSFADSADRKKLHIGAVFINNFTNHMAYLAKEFVESNELNWEFLKPLLEETTNKIMDVNPFDVQTGPARRNDQLVINNHLEQLTGTPHDIYKIVTKSIVNTYHKKEND